MDVTLRLIVISCVRTTFTVRAVLLGLGLLCLGVFNDQSFARSNSRPTARLMAITSSKATPLILQYPSKCGDVSIAADDGETNRAGPRIDLDGARIVSAASTRRQGLLSVPVCFSQILTPKVSRYISKSVLIL